MAFERTLIQIRERSSFDVLDLALVVVRRHPRQLGLAAMAGIAPFAALNAWLTTDPDFPIAWFAVLLLLEAPWATAPLTAMLGDLMFGQRTTARRVLGRLVRSLPALIVHQFLLRGLLMTTVILYPSIPTRLAFLNEVILLERDRWSKAIRRSTQLCARRGGDLFAQWLAQLACGAVFLACFWCGTGAALTALTTSEMTWEQPGWGDLYGVRAQCALWVAIAFFTIVRFLTYIDRRIRNEGWEIELRMMDVGRTMEEAREW